MRLFAKTDLLVRKVIYEGGEAPHLVLYRRREPRNVLDKYCVEVSRHLQVVAGTQGLEITHRSTGQQVNVTEPQCWFKPTEFTEAEIKFWTFRSMLSVDDLAQLGSISADRLGLSALSGAQDPNRDVLTQQKPQVNSFCSVVKESGASH